MILLHIHDLDATTRYKFHNMTMHRQINVNNTRRYTIVSHGTEYLVASSKKQQMPKWISLHFSVVNSLV